MKKVLDEQKFQYSGCVDTKCAVEIGMMLGAKYIVVGSVSKVGNTYSIDSRLINVKTGESYQSAEFNHKGEIDYLLLEGMKSVAYQLCDIEYQAKPPPPVKTEIDLSSSFQANNNTNNSIGGHLIINSNPQGATVFIEGSILGITPIEIKNYPIGEYRIGLELKNHFVMKDDERYSFFVEDIKIVPYGKLEINEKFIELLLPAQKNAIITLAEIRGYDLKGLNDKLSKLQICDNLDVLSKIEATEIINLFQNNHPSISLYNQGELWKEILPAQKNALITLAEEQGFSSSMLNKYLELNYKVNLNNLSRNQVILLINQFQSKIPPKP